MIRTYSELILLPTFADRFNYLKLSGRVGEDTFGFERYLNQKFYQSFEWRRIRDQIIIRDCGCDLGVPGYEIPNGVKIYIHHMNPLLSNDIIDRTEYLTNPEYLIATTHETHNAIHYGDEEFANRGIVIERTKYDTCPWRR